MLGYFIIDWSNSINHLVEFATGLAS